MSNQVIGTKKSDEFDIYFDDGLLYVEKKEEFVNEVPFDPEDPDDDITGDADTIKLMNILCFEYNEEWGLSGYIHSQDDTKFTVETMQNLINERL